MSYNRFTAFYGGQHSGRKMNWLYHMSKGELVTNCFKNKYTLQVRSHPDPDHSSLCSNFSGFNVPNVSAAGLQ